MWSEKFFLTFNRKFNVSPTIERAERVLPNNWNLKEMCVMNGRRSQIPYFTFSPYIERSVWIDIINRLLYNLIETVFLFQNLAHICTYISCFQNPSLMMVWDLIDFTSDIPLKGSRFRSYSIKTDYLNFTWNSQVSSRIHFRKHLTMKDSLLVNRPGYSD